MSTPISFNVTGLDTETIIQELMKIERQPVTALENKQKIISGKKAAWNDLKSKLESLMSKIKPLLEQETFEAKTVKVDDPAVVKASASAAAIQGAYQIEVISLAKAHTIQSKTFNSPDEALGLSGTLKLTFGDVTEDITVSAGDSLNSIAERINGLKDLGINATVLQVAPSEYTLVLTGTATGQAIAFDESSFDELLRLGLQEVEPPAQAEFKINGITFRRNSNEIADAIPGLTLTLLKTGVTSVSVTYDDDALVSKVKDFVNEYNSLVELAAKYNSYDSETQTAGLLFGDPLLQRMLSQIRETLFSPVEGSTELRYIGEIGINTGSIGAYTRDGKISLDESKLREALASNRDAVSALLRPGESGSEGVLSKLRQALEMYVGADGLLPLRQNTLEAQARDISRQIENLERRLEMRLESLRRQFATLEYLLMQMNTQGMFISQQIMGMFS